jgi:transcriptional regulator with XRE-family HTH domain
LFVVCDQNAPRGVCMRLEDWGYEATALQLQEADAEPAAPSPVETETAPPPAAHPEEPEMSRALPSTVPCKTAKEAGALIQRLREKMDDPFTAKPPMTRKSLAMGLGLTSSYVAAIEAGKSSPAGNVCLAIERLLKLPANTLPRLAKRENHRINVLAKLDEVPSQTPKAEPPPVVVVAAPPPPAPLPPAPPPPTLEEMIEKASARDVIAALHALQQRLDEVGLEHVDMTPLHLAINYAAKAKR